VKETADRAGRDLARHKYYMKIAESVAEGANCLGRSVGSIIVRENRIVSTGYNGTPEGVKNCLDHGCPRCDPQTKASWGITEGAYYDICLCVHAEENALITAARFGSPVADGAIYTTLQPCFICMRELLQAKILHAYYRDSWVHPKTKDWQEIEAAYGRMRDVFKVFQQLPAEPAAGPAKR
jgi:dCMP deaminase